MSLDTSHCLVQSIRSAMLVVRTLEVVLVKYDERLLCRILRTMQIPVMTRISDAVKIIIAVVLGALLLAALTLIFNNTVIPRITQEINKLFS